MIAMLSENLSVPLSDSARSRVERYLRKVREVLGVNHQGNYPTPSPR